MGLLLLTVAMFTGTSLRACYSLNFDIGEFPWGTTLDQLDEQVRLSLQEFSTIRYPNSWIARYASRSRCSSALSIWFD